MEYDSGFQGKMDALDLIINALKDHERKLDAIYNRLEGVFEKIRNNKIDVIGVPKKENQIEALVDKKPVLIITHWKEFKDRCKEAEIVAYDIDDYFKVYSMVKGNIYRYSESLPNKKFKVIQDHSRFTIDKSYLDNIDLIKFLINGRLKCGLSLSINCSKTILLDGKEFLFEISYNSNSDGIKEFLSRELDISKSSIVEGKIT